MKTPLTKIAFAAATGTVLSLGAIANSAEAASFNFSYTLQNGDILSGMLEGEVQADNDTVIVSEISMASFNDVLGPELTLIESFFEFLTGTPGVPTVSFSGSVMDIIACGTSNCSDGFLFEGSGSLFGTPAYSSGFSYGNTFDNYNPERWQLTAKNVTSVPEPASLLGLLAVGALGIASHRKGSKLKKAE
ncbi:PEP-CTERM sorting domain-containing protein [Oscillatoria salina]|uniref:PEP-CTERM sorting domain-containing protein n=1 Tax=Oscillatoria salina TaxID=331517 RepID=UPI0013B6B344|nr:PEP-CTERM sorting domain-containing protein [Oscillatoria salina]MBZ8181450.1 PEP-CTERM sorting domain-containing protein [Oscillatoria salina IIICB1]NET88406.1 PEP-CTERM sorting domain-containing protein [Kamptonema sp. SIO1D9]